MRVNCSQFMVSLLILSLTTSFLPSFLQSSRSPLFPVRSSPSPPYYQSTGDDQPLL